MKKNDELKKQDDHVKMVEDEIAQLLDLLVKRDEETKKTDEKKKKKQKKKKKKKKNDEGNKKDDVIADLEESLVKTEYLLGKMRSDNVANLKQNKRNKFLIEELQKKHADLKAELFENEQSISAHAVTIQEMQREIKRKDPVIEKLGHTLET